MSDSFRILTPHGIAVDVNQTQMSRMGANYLAGVDPNTSTTVPNGLKGTAINAFYPYTPLDGALVAAVRPGQHTVNQVGARGTMEVEVTAGATGGVVTLATLQELQSPQTPNYVVQISFDASNQPTVLITSDGTTVAEFAGSAAIAEGKQVKYHLEWDADAGTVSLTYVDGTAVAGSWTTDPAGTPWVSVPLTYLLVGFADGLTDFNGTVGVVQVV